MDDRSLNLTLPAHWVRVEFDPKGSSTTEFCDLNLALIERVRAERNPDGSIFKISIRYAGGEFFTWKGAEAETLYEFWNEYVELKQKAQPFKAGMLLKAIADNPTDKLG